jgi:hypothetical protein
LTNLLVLQLAIGIILTLFCSAVPRGTYQVQSLPLIFILAILVVVAAAGAFVGIPLFPLSDLIVLSIGLAGGVLVGRAFPARLRPFLVLLIVLSIVDLVQAGAFIGPPPGAAPSHAAGPNPHLIWVNFRLPLPSGHFNIGIADLLLITAMAEHLRRMRLPYLLSALPATIGLTLAIALSAVPGFQHLLGGAPSQALIPYLTLGFLGVVPALVSVRR